MVSMMERCGSAKWLGLYGTNGPMSPMDTLESPERIAYPDPLGPGERELRWSLMRVRCWDCREESGAWLKEYDTDIDAELALERASWHDAADGIYSDETYEEKPSTNRTDDIGCNNSFEGEKCTSASVHSQDAGKSTNLKRPSHAMLLSPLVISSGLLSPPVDGGPLNGVEESGGFYMLKKDSQRRQTIVKVMQEDKEQLLSIWMDRIRGTLPPASGLLIREEHLKQLLAGIVAYLPAQDKNPLSKVLAVLKESLDYDGQAVSQLQTALFVFQQSVMDILQARQNIKPHWMFALDNLVKQCCQAAVSILSPELAANISGHNIEEEEDDRISTTSGVSTSNSNRSAAHRTGEESPATHLPSNLPENTDFFKYFKILGTEQEKTASLVNTLVKSEKLYQDVLVTILQSRRHQQRFVQDVASNGTESQPTSHVSLSSQETMSGSSAAAPAPVVKENGDPAMVKWLEDIGLDEESVLKFVKERFTIEDVLQLVDRDDLRRLGLKLGYEVRVWTQIQRHRSQKEAPAVDSAPNNSLEINKS